MRTALINSFLLNGSPDKTTFKDYDSTRNEGVISGGSIIYPNLGLYWTSEVYNSSLSKLVFMQSAGLQVNTNNTDKHFRGSVRCVHD